MAVQASGSNLDLRLTLQAGARPDAILELNVLAGNLAHTPHKQTVYIG
jgi:hypothetical protein